MNADTDTERQFAYGADRVADTPCPATAAGYQPSVMSQQHDEVWYGRIADQYDLYVALELFERDGGSLDDLNDAAIHDDLRDRGYDRGVIDEALARPCWREAWECQGAEPEGHDVEEKLGWLDD